MKKHRTNFIIDFDSTFISVEAFDELCKLCFPRASERLVVLEQVQDITNRGMNGELSIQKSLGQRLALMKAHKSLIAPLVEILRGKVSASFARNKRFIKSHSDSIYIVSNGFSEFILPIVLEFGIHPNQVFANTFEYDVSGNITGFDKRNVLAGQKGKVKLVSSLNLSGETIVVGDGYTDYEIKEAGLAKIFYAFTENVTRETVVCKTNYIAPNLDHIIMDLSDAAIEDLILLTL